MKNPMFASPRSSQSALKPLLVGVSMSALAASTSFAQVLPNRARLQINNLAPVIVKANDSGTLVAQDGQSIAYFASDVEQPNRRTLQVRVQDPVLCADFSVANTNSRVRMRIVNPNNEITLAAAQGVPVRGFNGITSYTSGSDTGGFRFFIRGAAGNTTGLATFPVLKVTTDNTLRCFTFDNAVAAPNDDIFLNGFESNSIAASNGDSQIQGGVGIDLNTRFSAISGATLTTARPGQALEYLMIVSNNGTVTASNVQVRDYFPKRGTSTSGNDNLTGPAFASGSWSCQGLNGAGCGAVTSGTDYVFLSGATIPAQGSLRISISRELLNTPVLAQGIGFSLFGAAFSDPSGVDSQPLNDGVRQELVTQTNTAPSLSIVSNPPRGRGECTSTLNPCDAIVAVIDPDGDSSTAVVSAVAQSANITVVGVTSLNSTQRRVRYLINSLQTNGEAIQVSAVDAAGAAAQPLNLGITITDPVPVLSALSNQICDEDQQAASATCASSTNAGGQLIIELPLQVSGAGVVATDVTFMAAEVTDPTGVTLAANNVQVFGTGANRIVRVTIPRDNYNSASATVGSLASISLTAQNGNANSTPAVFTLRIVAVNDAPTGSVQAVNNVTSPTGASFQNFSGWVVSQLPGPANEVTPVPGSSVAAQQIDFRDLQINNQSASSVLQGINASLGANNSTLRVQWVAGTVPTGAACVQVLLTDTLGASAAFAGVVSANGGTVSCTPQGRSQR